MPGIPISSQAPGLSRAKWQAVVRAAAQVAWGTGVPCADTDLALLVVHLHDEDGGNIDNDNMVKPIQDALIGVIYVDDRQITDTWILRRSLTALQLVNPSPDAAAAVAAGTDFVLIRISTRTEEVDFS